MAMRGQCGARRLLQLGGWRLEVERLQQLMQQIAGAGAAREAERRPGGRRWRRLFQLDGIMIGQIRLGRSRRQLRVAGQTPALPHPPAELPGAALRPWRRRQARHPGGGRGHRPNGDPVRHLCCQPLPGRARGGVR
jgi:hypothetical protein